MLKFYSEIAGTNQQKDLNRIVPVPPPSPKLTPVDIPGVLNQTRNLYKPYTGQDHKDNK